jgi:transposase InsO family protein
VYRFIRENQDRYTVTKMTGLFGVSRSAYYRWEKQGASGLRERAERELAEKLRDLQEDHHWRYGAPRLQIELRKQGVRVSRKRIGKLLRKYGLNARRKRRYMPTTQSNHGLPVCGNLLNRDFGATEAGRKWVSDITYLDTAEGWRYLTTVLDLFNREVVGWAFSSDMTAEHTALPAPAAACMKGRPREGLLFHSYRGVQYCAASFRERLEELCPAVRQSMSRKGNCWDNACAESFFKTLKTELETLDGRHSALEVRDSVFEYIEVYYNRKRLHSSLDYSTPAEAVCKKTA